MQSDSQANHLHDFLQSLALAASASDAAAAESHAAEDLALMREEADMGASCEPIARREVVSSLASLYIKLVEMRCNNLYHDDLQLMMGDVTMWEHALLPKAAGPQRPGPATTHDAA